MDSSLDDITRSGGILFDFADGIFHGMTAQRFGQFLPARALETKMDEKLGLVSADGVSEVDQIVPDFLGRDDHGFNFWQSRRIDFQDIIIRTKSWKVSNLRDHMSDLELIFSMLGEAATIEIARNRDTQGFPQNKQAARSGGKVAGNARRELEKKSGRKVVTNENYLGLAQTARKAKRIK